MHCLSRKKSGAIAVIHQSCTYVLRFDLLYIRSRSKGCVSIHFTWSALSLFAMRRRSREEIRWCSYRGCREGAALSKRRGRGESTNRGGKENEIIEQSMNWLWICIEVQICFVQSPQMYSISNHYHFWWKPLSKLSLSKALPSSFLLLRRPLPRGPHSQSFLSSLMISPATESFLLRSKKCRLCCTRPAFFTTRHFDLISWWGRDWKI